MSAYTVQIDVLPQYVAQQSDPLQDVFAFAYTVTVTNTGRMPVQLISRHWVIQDERGHTEEVKGLGVVGQQPLLRPGESFQYTSGTRLAPPPGSRRGSFLCGAEAGERFEAPVPEFALRADGAGPGEAPARVLH